MSDTPNKFYVTTPIYYVNDEPHIGHVYTTTIADIVARYHRLKGDDVFFLTGTDEHASKVVDAAAERGLSTQDWADRNAAAFQATFERYGMSHDDFIRTSQDRHKQKVIEYVGKLRDSGDVYLGQYEGWYDAGQEEYIPDNKAKDQDYKSAITKKPLIRRKEPCYYFRLSTYGDVLLKLLDEGEYDIKPTARKNEIIARIKDGLLDVPISRAAGLDWGIAVPGDAEHVIYVWIDALINYLSAVDTPDRRQYWPADVHFIGKDILWFHAVIWPAMLVSLAKHEGYGWVKLPRVVYAHSFWTSEGMKMSKMLGNFIDLKKLDSYVNEFGRDALSYYLGTQGPLSATDSDFSQKHFAEVYNADFANTVGNSLSRTLNMTTRYCDGKVPSPAPGSAPGSALESAPGSAPGSAPESTDAGEFAKSANEALAAYHAAFESLDLVAAADAAVGLVRTVDNYIEQTQPFKLAKDPEKAAEVATILYRCAELLRIASLLLWPFIPSKAEEIWRRLGCSSYAESLADRGRGELDTWATWGQLQPGTPVIKGDPLFPRYELNDDDAEASLKKPKR